MFQDFLSRLNPVNQISSLLQLPYQQRVSENAATQNRILSQRALLQPRKPKATSTATSPQDSLAQLMKQLKALQYQSTSTPTPPYFDVGGAFSRAKKTAAGVVNPYYVKKLNDFLAQQKIKQGRAQQDASEQEKDLEEALALAGEEAGIQRGRVGEDVDRNLAQLGEQESLFQEESGTGFERARRALSSDIAQAGLTGSGLGAQQIAEAEKGRRTGEAAQVKSFNIQKEAQKQFKTRTFADLARGETLAGKRAEKGKARVKIALDRYIQDLGVEEQQTRGALEESRLSRLQQEQQNQARIAYLKFLSKLKPSKLASAQSAYGGIF